MDGWRCVPYTHTLFTRTQQRRLGTKQNLTDTVDDEFLASVIKNGLASILLKLFFSKLLLFLVLLSLNFVFDI